MTVDGNALLVLVLAAPRDAELTCEFMRGVGMLGVPCGSPAELVDRVGEPSTGAMIIANELMGPRDFAALAAVINRQPPWSDLPVILFSGRRLTARDAEHLIGRFNATIMERPVSRSTLLTAVRSALRARRRQLEARAVLDRLEQANRRLAEQDRRKDEFMAVLGHELRNPLGAIRIAVSMLELARTEEAAARHRAVIERQSRNLTRMVDDLLDVSRVSRGKIQLAIETVDLREVARRCVQALEADARVHRHALSLTTPAWPVVVDGDPVRLDQVLANLVTNAIKYTPDGGRIEIIVERDRHSAVLKVRDTGIGIGDDVLPSLFEAFVQADKSLARAQGGLGLGLAVTKAIVELHQGTIEARSEGEGRGAEFAVHLPLSTHALARPRVSAPTAAPTAALRVALVEDNDDARELMADFLRMIGHQVDVARDGAQGLSLITTMRPDIAIVDIGLPVIDGYEVARQVRLRGLDVTRLVALTGYGQPDDRKRAIEAGFDIHLVKPVDLESLARMIAETRGRASAAGGASAGVDSANADTQEASTRGAHERALDRAKFRGN